MKKPTLVSIEERNIEFLKKYSINPSKFLNQRIESFKNNNLVFVTEEKDLNIIQENFLKLNQILLNYEINTLDLIKKIVEDNLIEKEKIKERESINKSSEEISSEVFSDLGEQIIKT